MRVTIQEKVNLDHSMMVLMEDMGVENLRDVVHANVEEQEKDVEQEKEDLKDVDVEQRRVNSVNVNPNLKYNYF